MTKIAITGPATGTGNYTLHAPDTDVDRDVTLPDAGGQIHTSESANDHASMPTVVGDPIVESGSNSDGEWTKWADGSMHQVFVGTNKDINTNEASGQKSAIQSVESWPIPFIDANYSVHAWDQDSSLVLGVACPSTGSFFNLRALHVQTASGRTIKAAGFGRWK